MIKKNKRASEQATKEPVAKKLKKEITKSGTQDKIKSGSPNKIKSGKDKTTSSSQDETKSVKKVKFNKKVTTSSPKNSFKSIKPVGNKKITVKNGKDNSKAVTPTDWVKFKKEKKELAIKRKQSKGSYDIIVKAKKIGEAIRRKTLQGGEEERSKLILKLHNEIKGKGHYAKFVLTHDVGRVVQYLLKFGTKDVKQEITKELVPVTVPMLESKYGKFCVKRMLKYSNSEIRSSIIKAMYGHAVKLTSHGISASVFEYAYSTWATPLERQHLTQEFFGDMYKQSKDDNIKHLKDTYKDSPAMKSASLGAAKANLTRIMNKDLYDSMLVHTVLFQYLSECSDEDRAQIITEIAPHAVVLSNSRDGSRVVMICMWHGTNKDRKVIVKSLKEHLFDLCKHEHGHCSIIALIDCIDDTVLLQKSIINEILNKAKELVQNEWGRKVLIWLVAPADSTHIHIQFIKELQTGREASSCKKAPEIRRKEVLNGSISKLLNIIISEPEIWLSTASIAVVTLAILKTGSGDDLTNCLKKICEVIVKPYWQITENEKIVNGIEHSGLHMILKKLAQNDKINQSKGETTFGEALLDHVTDEAIEMWIKCNRGCFLLITVYENSTDVVKNLLKEKLKPYHKLLKKDSTKGASILLQKIKE